MRDSGQKKTTIRQPIEARAANEDSDAKDDKKDPRM